MAELTRVPVGVDPSVPSSARVYDYLLDGKDNFEIDRALAARLLEVAPDTRLVAKASRRFLVSAVRHMAESGVRQFLDLGAGIPTSPSVHEIAREIHPDARVAYVDYDPVVKLHNEVILSVGKDVISLQADVRDPGSIIGAPEITELVDFSEPVGVLLLGVLHFVTDAEDPAGIVRAFRDRMAPGSHLLLSHAMAESAPEAVAQLKATTAGSPAQPTFRTHDQVLALFDGFDLVEPGLVPVQDWRPDLEEPSTKLRVEGGLGRRS
ncbi:SAM-dependent methyltransferase [Planomonospora sp. ID67723]|uniref:SAM-dependent methyltransferase n=1 Tax=Planomonospora sp. ID67723 TaxID=2738134 RepID=UPI0018C41F7B|nr:SAM-dependent methyltransferase [Planomonospora sp. ID67723]MBG0830301.1 SAM-dependent methyltransferase [Planomonospora sp. ID67723]